MLKVILSLLFLQCHLFLHPLLGQSPSSGEALKRLLDHLLDSPRLRQPLFVEAACQGGEGYRAARLYGTGVGVWGSHAQIPLEPEQMRGVLTALRQGRFFDMAKSYGGGGPEGDFAKVVICQILLEHPRGRKQVVQYKKGRQSRQLKELANEILDIASASLPQAVRASSLPEAIDRLASGRLAPETSRIEVQHRPESGPGWILNIHGRSARIWVLEGLGVSGEPSSARISPQDTAKLAQALREHDFSTLPVNIQGEGYTEISVRILDQAKKVLAREFAGREPDPQALRRFQAILEAASALRRQIPPH